VALNRPLMREHPDFWDYDPARRPSPAEIWVLVMEDGLGQLTSPIRRADANHKKVGDRTS
jgi:hypothetical protein